MAIIIGYVDGTKQKEKVVDIKVSVVGTKKQVKERLNAIASEHVDAKSIIYVMECKLND